MKNLKRLLETARNFIPKSKENVLRIYAQNSEEFEKAWKKLQANPENQEFFALLPNGLWLQWEEWPLYYKPRQKITLYTRVYTKNNNVKIACLKVMA